MGNLPPITTTPTPTPTPPNSPLLRPSRPPFEPESNAHLVREILERHRMANRNIHPCLPSQDCRPSRAADPTADPVDPAVATLVHDADTLTDDQLNRIDADRLTDEQLNRILDRIRESFRREREDRMGEDRPGPRAWTREEQDRWAIGRPVACRADLLSTLAPGSPVWIGPDLDPIRAHVAMVMIGTENIIKYYVVWWENGERRSDEFQTFEVRERDDDGTFGEAGMLSVRVARDK